MSSFCMSINHRCIADPVFEDTNNAHERCLVFMHKVCSRDAKYLSRQIVVQSYKTDVLNLVLNLFKVNNKGGRLTLVNVVLVLSLNT